MTENETETGCVETESYKGRKNKALYELIESEVKTLRIKFYEECKAIDKELKAFEYYLGVYSCCLYCIFCLYYIDSF